MGQLIGWFILFFSELFKSERPYLKYKLEMDKGIIQDKFQNGFHKMAGMNLLEIV